MAAESPEFAQSPSSPVRRNARVRRIFAGFVVAIASLGVSAAHPSTYRDSPSIAAMPIPPPCLLNNNCGVDDNDADDYMRQLRAACDELQSRGQSSPDCDALNRNG